MENITKAILQLKQFLFNQFKDGFFNARVLNSEDISNPIVKAIEGKKQEILDPDEISDPIISKLEDVIQSIESKEISNEDVVGSIKELATVFQNELGKIEMNVEAPVVNLDQKELIQQIKENNTKLLDKIDKVCNNKEKGNREEIDYTPILSDLCDLVEQAKPVINLSIIEDTLLDILDKKLELPLEDDRVKVVLSDKQIDKLNQNQRIFLPGGVENKAGQKVNPATIEKQDEIISAIENIPATDTSALATEAKQDSIIALQANYALQLDDTTTANVTYIGKAAIGSATSAAVWQIYKLDETTGMIKTWAGGTDAFDQVWDDRASLIYS